MRVATEHHIHHSMAHWTQDDSSSCFGKKQLTSPFFEIMHFVLRGTRGRHSTGPFANQPGPHREVETEVSFGVQQFSFRVDVKWERWHGVSESFA